MCSTESGELDRSRPVVTVCRSGSRSAEAAEDLASAGFEVQNLEGGMEGWVFKGLAGRHKRTAGLASSSSPSRPPMTVPRRCSSSRPIFWR